MTTQLSFDLPTRTARGRGDFFISTSNAVALSMVDAPDSWPQRKMILLGPPQSGKTHLKDIWLEDHQALRWPFENHVLPPDGSKVAVDNVDALAGDEVLETQLFHLHNHLMATDGCLLMTSTKPIGQAGFILPDLRSRLEATHVARIDAPDDILLQAVILKQFADRQLAPPPQVTAAITRYMERSFTAAARTVAELDKRSMDQGRKITRGMVMDVIADLQA